MFKYYESTIFTKLFLCTHFEDACKDNTYNKLKYFVFDIATIMLIIFTIESDCL